MTLFRLDSTKGGFKVVFLSLILWVFVGNAFAATPPLLPFNNTGDLYVLESASGTILRVTPAGTVSIAITEAQILAATGGTEARFTDNGIAFNIIGTIFFTDSEEDLILKASPAGGAVSVLTTNAAIQAATGEDSAQPEGVALSDDGFLYVVDNSSDSVLRVNPLTGAVSVYVDRAAFESVPGITTMDIETGIAAAEGGIIYAESDDGKTGAINAIFSIAAGGTPSIVASGSPPFNDLDVFMTRIQNGDLIVADNSGADTIHRVTPGGTVSTFLSEAALEAPTCVNGDVDLEGGIAFDSSGVFYMAEDNTDSLYRFTSGTLICSLFVSAADIQAVTGEAPALNGGIAFAPPLALVPIPTLNEWGMMVLILLIAVFSVRGRSPGILTRKLR